MKIEKNKITLFLLLMIISVAASAQAKLTVKDAKQSFGSIKKGEVVKLNYEITNDGNEPLLINKVEVSCSCTSVEFDKKPVLPMQKTIVTVIFDTKTVYDRQDRVVEVFSNDKKGPHKLRYKGVVLK